MKSRIQDKFTRLPVSRQRKYQLRMRQKKRCIICGEPAANATHCLFHMIKCRERHRAKQNFQRRNLGSRSYGLQLSSPLAGQLASN